MSLTGEYSGRSVEIDVYNAHWSRCFLLLERAIRFVMPPTLKRVAKGFGPIKSSRAA